MSDYDDLVKRRSKRYNDREKEAIINDFLKSGMTIKNYCLQSTCSEASLGRWLRQSKLQKKEHKGNSSTPDERRLAVEAFLKSGMPMNMFAKTWGINPKTFYKWWASYKKLGPQGLEAGNVYGTGKKKGPKGIKSIIKEKIVEAKSDFPTFGLKKLQQNLKRLQGVKVSANTIKKVLMENGSYEPQVSERVKKSPPQVRRFERANPMQLWQSDITSYVLRGQKQRVYLVVFMDDHSRYIVSWSLGLKQTGSFVIETLFDGFQRFGKPEEVLTDQGRQYFSWRGKSEFQKILQKEDVNHVVSRSHHPQTLGKCERFWKTVGKEFWDRANPRELHEARERFSHFVNHYNHFRPHQGLDGMTPSDRFFGLESEVRNSIEETLEANELRIALDQSPKKPMFLVGQIGDQKLSMHGESGRLVVNTPCGSEHEFSYEDFGHKKVGDKNERYYNKYDKNKEEERSQDDDQLFETSSSSEGALGDCEQGRERTCSYEGPSDRRILDGTNIQSPSEREVRSEPPESLAIESISTIRDVRGAFETTEEEESEYEQRRGPYLSEEENQKTRRDDRDAGSLDRDFEVDARVQGSETTREKYQEEYRSEEKWEQDQEGTHQNFEKRWDSIFSKKEEE